MISLLLAKNVPSLPLAYKASFLLSIHPKPAWPSSSKLLKHMICTTHVVRISWLTLLIISLCVTALPNLAVKGRDGVESQTRQAGGRKRQGGWRLRPRPENSWQKTRNSFTGWLSGQKCRQRCRAGPLQSLPSPGVLPFCARGPLLTSPRSRSAWGLRKDDGSGLGKATTNARSQQQAKVKGMRPRRSWNGDDVRYGANLLQPASRSHTCHLQPPGKDPVPSQDLQDL